MNKRSIEIIDFLAGSSPEVVRKSREVVTYSKRHFREAGSRSADAARSPHRQLALEDMERSDCVSLKLGISIAVVELTQRTRPK